MIIIILGIYWDLEMIVFRPAAGLGERGREVGERSHLSGVIESSMAFR